MTVSVATANPYEVHVGRGVIDSVPGAIPDTVATVAIIHSGPLGARAKTLTTAIQATGRTCVTIEVPDAEAGKTAEVAAFCWTAMGQSNLTRSDLVIGLGGGAATDLAGFVAATWLRGISLIQVPTTVLGMVDAAVGGKTGINTTEGKNLVGAFHEPLSVWCDTDVLDTLPVNDRIAGLAEVVKCGFIADTTILDRIERDTALLTAEILTDEGHAALADVMESAIRVKADVVAQDLKESHLREILNYGHTFGHAIEYTERYAWRHGAAVSVGMVFAAELSRLAGKLDDAGVSRHRDILTSLGLPTSYVPGRWDALLTAMRRDKKSRGAMLRFVVLSRVGAPERLEGPDPALLASAYDAVSGS